MEFVVNAVAAVFAAVGVTGSIAGVSYATIAAWVVVTAASVAVTYALARQQLKPKNSEQQQTVRQPVPDRRITYGRDKLGGALLLEDTRANVLWQVHCFGQGPWDGIESLWLNTTQCGPDLSTGSATAQWGSYVVVEPHLGEVGQAASAKLMAALSYWSEDHRGDGLCYAVMGCGCPSGKNAAQQWQQIYSGGVPSLRALGRGLRVYDPRDGATRWSENAGLCIRDYLASPWGLNIPPAYIADERFSTFADSCDDLVATSTGYEPRYSLSHTFTLNTAPTSVLAELQRACDAELYPLADGRIGIAGGVWTEPTVEIFDDDIVEPLYEYTRGNGRNVAYNRLKTTFKDISNDYQPVEVAPWDDVASQAVQGVLVQDLRLEAVTSFSQARRLAKIRSARDNPRHRLVINVRYAAAIRMWGELSIRLTLSELGIAGEAFVIRAAALDMKSMKGRFTLSSLGPEAFEFSPEEEGPRPVITADVSASVPPVPTGLALLLERTEITSGVFSTAILASVSSLGGASSLLPGTGASWGTVFRYRRTGAVDWLMMAGDGQYDGRSAAVDDGAEYEVQAAHTGLSGAASLTRSAWTDSQIITATADPVPPAPPVDVTVSKSGNDVTVAWTTPNSANFAGVQVWRGTSATFAEAALVATIYSAASAGRAMLDAGRPDGTWFYWACAINRSGVASAAVASDPVSVTIP